RSKVRRASTDHAVETTASAANQAAAAAGGRNGSSKRRTAAQASAKTNRPMSAAHRIPPRECSITQRTLLEPEAIARIVTAIAHGASARNARSLIVLEVPRSRPAEHRACAGDARPPND